MNSIWFYYSLIKKEFWKSKKMFKKEKIEHHNLVLMFSNISSISFVGCSSK